MEFKLTQRRQKKLQFCAKMYENLSRLNDDIETLFNSSFSFYFTRAHARSLNCDFEFQFMFRFSALSLIQ